MTIDEFARGFNATVHKKFTTGVTKYFIETTIKTSDPVRLITELRYSSEGELLSFRKYMIEAGKEIACAFSPYEAELILRLEE